MESRLEMAHNEKLLKIHNFRLAYRQAYVLLGHIIQMQSFSFVVFFRRHLIWLATRADA